MHIEMELKNDKTIDFMIEVPSDHRSEATINSFSIQMGDHFVKEDTLSKLRPECQTKQSKSQNYRFHKQERKKRKEKKEKHQIFTE